jgi:shikimate kinase
MSLIFLIGMPGVGKTYWGTQMAAALSMPFIDLDKYIEETEGESISYIFQQYGEPIFREKETLAIQSLINNVSKSALIATGGGTPAFGSNLDLMKSAGCVLYLRGDVETVLAHLQHDTTERPLLTNGDAKLQLNDLLQKRQQYYEQAHHILDVEHLTVTTFAQIIARCTDRPS